MDLAEWYAAGRWVALLDLIDMLPSASRLNEAITNDPEAAEALAEQYLADRDKRAEDGDEPDNSPRISEYGLTNRQLRDLIDETKKLQQAIIASVGGTPKPEKPSPAPRTAADKIIADAIAAADNQWASDFIQLFGFSPDDI